MKPPTTAAERRRQTEARLKEQKSAVSGPTSAAEANRLLHELETVSGY